MDLETALFEGDLRTYRHIADLCDAPRPLLQCEPPGSFRLPSDPAISREDFLRQRLALTSVGGQVLSGQIDAWDAIYRDEWRGGVHLVTGRTMWMWDPEENKVLFRR